MKIQSHIKILFIFFSFVIIKSFDLNNQYLISELENSDKPCIRKLLPILKSLSISDQEAIYRAISSDDERCFDPNIYRGNLAENLKSLNVAYGDYIGNNVNKDISSFECFVSAAKSKLSDSDVEEIKNILSYINPNGLYYSKNRCIANFIQIVNYVLAKRRSYLFTKISNIEEFAIEDSDGNYLGFPWKIAERDVIVNEFFRLERCLSDYSSGMTNPIVGILNYFANSKSCGEQPGALDKLYYYYGYGEIYDKYEPPYFPLDPTTEPSEPITGGSSTPDYDKTNSGSSSEGNVASEGETTNEEVIDPNIYPEYDPCNSYTVKPQKDITSVSDSIETSYKTDKSVLYESVFCPNLVGQDLNEWETAFYDGTTVTEALKMVPDARRILENVGKCLISKNPQIEGLKYFVNLEEDFTNTRLQPQSLSTPHSFLTDSSAIDEVNNLIQQINENLIETEFTLTCINNLCECKDCPTPINIKYDYINYDDSSNKDKGYDYYMNLPTNFYILVTKCGSNFIYFSYISWNQYSNIDIKYSTDNSNKLINLNDEYFSKMYFCMIDNTQNNITSKECGSEPLSQINKSCKETISEECQSTNLEYQLEQLRLFKTFATECDFSKVDIRKTTNYEKLKENCFEFLNTYLIEGSLYLNPKAIINLGNIKENHSKALRFLQSSSLVKIYYITEPNKIDEDVDANFEKESILGSYGQIDIDGSSNLYFYRGIYETTKDFSPTGPIYSEPGSDKNDSSEDNKGENDEVEDDSLSSKLASSTIGMSYMILSLCLVNMISLF